MNKPLAIDLYAGLGGWTEALLAEGWNVIGFDIERHDYGTGGYPGQLVLQDVCTLHGAQFRDADLIVASPPCQEFSYRAMPWKRAKALPPPYLGMNLFWQCWRIQHEACEASGRYIPLVVENVKGAQRWIGQARAHFGSFYLWGDVNSVGDAIVGGQTKFGEFVRTQKHGKTPQGNAAGAPLWKDRPVKRLNESPGHSINTAAVGLYADRDSEGTKQGGDWFSDSNSASRTSSSRSTARKAASAQIAKIPEPLALHIAKVFKPQEIKTT